jgi:tetratricopeptide (TPR) repeat protein
MSQYKVCVYAIGKNEEHFVDRWMDSMTEADSVVVTDTGSTDGTVARLRRRGAVVYEETIDPWRFDTARNVSLSHVPTDTDIAVCTDLDEVFRPGWRQCLEDQWDPDVTMANYLYNWSLSEDGTPHTQFTYFKAHAMGCYVWACPVHEFLKFTPTQAFPHQKRVFVPDMILDHYPDSTKSRSSYLPLLQLGVRENPQDDRMAYYLGREYMFAGRWQACIDILTIHLGLPSATWKEERCASMRWIAKSYLNLGNKEQAYSWYYRAVAEMPRMRDPYLECAQAAYALGDWPTVLLMTTEALKINEKSLTYVNMGDAWNYTPHDLSAIACYRLGNYAQSLGHAEAALAFAPLDKRLQNNYELIKSMLEANA